MIIEPINVLSLFDGMSCGQIALNRLGIKYKNYFASEIDKHGVKVTQTHFPNTIQLGDVCGIQYENGALFHHQNNNPLKNGGSFITNIDLLIGGSPCQGFSFSGKQLNFNDPRSKLFFEFVRLKNEINPKYFLLENVVMKKEYEDIITKHLGVEPIMIDSQSVSAQMRKRMYWTNIPNISQPEDKGINLQDILEDIPINGITSNYPLNKATIIGRRLNERGVRDDYNKNIPITQCLEVRATNINKSNCITTVEKDNVLTTMPIGRHLDAFKNKLPFRYYTLKEYCRLQTVPDNYFEGIVSTNQGKKMIGNGWTIDVITHIFKQLPYYNN
jgi:DNA (cytosine-5)-methyltransferase 3A